MDYTRYLIEIRLKGGSVFDELDLESLSDSCSQINATFKPGHPRITNVALASSKTEILITVQNWNVAIKATECVANFFAFTRGFDKTAAATYIITQLFNEPESLCDITKFRGKEDTITATK